MLKAVESLAAEARSCCLPRSGKWGGFFCVSADFEFVYPFGFLFICVCKSESIWVWLSDSRGLPSRTSAVKLLHFI